MYALTLEELGTQLIFVPGDGQRPVCQRCITARKECVRSAKDFKFVFHTSNDAATSPPTLPKPPAFTVESRSSAAVLSTPPRNEEQLSDNLGSNLNVKQFQTSLSTSSGAPRGQRDGKTATVLAASSPKIALANAETAELLAHYTNVLAPWYDLNDSRRLFETLVPLNALDCPVLFKALIAFSASHKHNTSGDARGFAAAFHAACVREFLSSISKVEPRAYDNELAATCLLRSYEIISGMVRHPRFWFDHVLRLFRRHSPGTASSPRSVLFCWR